MHSAAFDARAAAMDMGVASAAHPGDEAALQGD
jgi:hypothetical protein